MSANMEMVWDAPAHTLAKIQMVRKYLSVWLSILGATFKGVDLWYIDGFAGPGEYTNPADGSPVAALQAADEALTKTAGWVAGDVHCVFIESDRPRFANLEKVLAAIPERSKVTRHLINGTFIEGIAALAQTRPNPFSPPTPLFAFIDPFGVVGFPFAVVKELLSRKNCEVLINLDSDGAARVYHAGDFANHRVVLNETFGDDEWEAVLARTPRHQIAHKILSLYKERLRAIPNVNYAFPFEMQKTAGKIDYHLVFATKHPLGLQKMKEVMRQFAKDGVYAFSDERDNGQSTLLQFEEPAAHAEQLATAFRGRTVKYSEVNDYALNDSPFLNPKQMLAELERADRLTVSCTKVKRRKCTYPEDTHPSMTITFPG